MTVKDEALIPVLIGTGQVEDRPARGIEGLDSGALMAAAARRAGEDAGGDLLARTDWLGIVSQISFPEQGGRLVAFLAEALGIRPHQAQETPQPTGDSPVRLLHAAANAIGSGRAQVALVVGAEALRTAGMRAAELAAAGGAVPPSPFGRRPKSPELRHRYGLSTPTDVYPLYENAGRAAYRQSLSEGQEETGQIWARLSEVAERNPAAWIRRKRTPEEIVRATADNRPIAFPYTKLMVANASVNQGAALLVTSLAVARAAGVPEQQIVYIGRGAAAQEAEDPLARANYHESPSMTVSLERTLALNGLRPDQLDHVELYSCFPCVPKMARRVLGWGLDRPASVFGGLTFGGGPIGNYMTHAAASMALALRTRGTYGLLFANGGYATHNHSIVLTRIPQPAGTFPQNFDVQAEADAARGPVPPLDPGYAGPATVETYTVLYDREGAARFGVVLGRTPDGRRAIARVPGDDARTIAWLTAGIHEPVGQPGQVVAEGELNRWVVA
ncbi:acetyl-CoA acetyltransferase [Sphingomonas sp. CJ20]